MTVNLLPWREKKKRQHIRHITFYCSVSACLVFFISIFMKNLLGYKTAILQKENRALKANIEAIAPNHLTQNTLFLIKIKRINSDKAKTTYQNKKMENNLFEIANILPESMLFQSMHMLNNKITIIGTGNKIYDIQNYVKRLQTKIKRGTITLSDVHRNTQSPSQFNFTIRVNL